MTVFAMLAAMAAVSVLPGQDMQPEERAGRDQYREGDIGYTHRNGLVL